MPKTDRPTRAQGRLIIGLLQLGRTEPDGWLPDEREAVTRLHTWAHGAPPRQGARPQAHPQPVHGHFQGRPDEGDGAVEVEYRHEGEVRVMPARLPHGTPAALAETDPVLVKMLTKAGDEWGPMGVALAAAAIAGPGAVLRQLGTVLDHEPTVGPSTPSGAGSANPHDPEGCDANLDALRAEVARLTGLLDEAGTRYEGMRERRNRARDHAVKAERERDLLGGEVEDERRRAEQAEAERDEARQAAAEARRDRDDARAQVVAAQQQIAVDGEQLDRTARHREALADEVRELRARALTAEDEVRTLREQRDGTEATLALYRQRGATHPPIELSVSRGPGTVTCDGHRLAVVYDPAVAAEAILADHEREHPDLDEPAEADTSPQLDRPTRVAGIDGDPRRPSRDHYDEVGVTLSWRELRNLVALHLDHADTSPARPHLLARAMREDGAPLRLAEVLDR